MIFLIQLYHQKWDNFIFNSTVPLRWWDGFKKIDPLPQRSPLHLNINPQLITWHILTWTTFQLSQLWSGPLSGVVRLLPSHPGLLLHRQENAHHLRPPVCKTCPGWSVRLVVSIMIYQHHHITIWKVLKRDALKNTLCERIPHHHHHHNARKRWSCLHPFATSSSPSSSSPWLLWF